MRSETWDRTIRRVRTPVPQNLGTVWYCEGNCIHPIYASQKNQTNPNRVDPSIPPDQGGPDMRHFVEHTRRLFAQMGVGMDVVERHLKPDLRFDFDVNAIDDTSATRIVLQVWNTRETGWYTQPQQAVLASAVVQLFAPPGIELIDGAESATVLVGAIEANGHRVVEWPVRVSAQAPLAGGHTLRARLTVSNGPPVETSSSRNSETIEAFKARDLYRSGDGWVEPAYRGGGARPLAVSLRALQGQATRPTITAGPHRIRYADVLAAGEERVLEPGGKGRIVPSNLIVGDLEELRDSDGPRLSLIHI